MTSVAPQTVFSATMVITALTAAAAPTDTLQASRAFSALRIAGGCSVQHPSTASLNDTTNNTRERPPVPFPRAILPVAIAGDTVLGALIGNIMFPLIVGGTTWAVSRRWAADGSRGEAWKNARFPTIMIGAALFVVDGITFAAVTLLLDSRAQAAFDAILAGVGVIFVAGTAGAAVAAQVLSPLRFVVATGDDDVPSPTDPPTTLSAAPRTASRAACVKWLLRVRGTWEYPGPERASGAQLDVERHYGTIFKPFVACVRAGPGLIAGFARYGVPVEVALTAASSGVEAWGLSTCGHRSAVLPAHAGLVVAIFSWLYLFICTPQPSILKAILAALTASLTVTVSVLVLVATKTQLASDASSMASLAVALTMTSAVVSSTSAAIGLLIAFLRQRAEKARRRAAAGGDSRDPPAPLVADDANELSTPLLVVRPTLRQENPLITTQSAA